MTFITNGAKVHIDERNTEYELKEQTHPDGSKLFQDTELLFDNDINNENIIFETTRLIIAIIPSNDQTKNLLKWNKAYHWSQNEIHFKLENFELDTSNFLSPLFIPFYAKNQFIITETNVFNIYINFDKFLNAIDHTSETLDFDIFVIKRQKRMQIQLN